MNITGNLYLNFHAHKQEPNDGEVVIQSLFLQDHFNPPKNDKISFTAGLHPWHADRMSKAEIENKLEALIKKDQILAVGETGMDKLKGPALDLQLKVFQVHIEVAEKYSLPVIVHSVKTHNEVLKLKKDLNSKVPWVLHHFNGSKQLAMDLIEHGFYLSLSHHIMNSDARLGRYLGDLPIDKIFLETDDFDVDIKHLYKVAADKFGKSEGHLKKQIIENLKELLNVK